MSHLLLRTCFSHPYLLGRREPSSQALPAALVQLLCRPLGVITVPHGGAVTSEGSEGGVGQFCQDREGVESALTYVISICFEEALGIVCYKDIVNVFLCKGYMAAGLP